MSTKIFIDTNVMLDFLGEREPFYESVAKIATLAEKKSLTTCRFTNLLRHSQLYNFKI